MRITTSTVSLTVDDVAASQDFFTTHLAYEVQAAADGFVSLTRKDAAVDIVLLRRGTEVLAGRPARPARLRPDPRFHSERHRGRGEAAAHRGRRDHHAAARGPWGERLFQVTDPNGIVVQFVEWTEAAVLADTGGA